MHDHTEVAANGAADVVKKPLLHRIEEVRAAKKISKKKLAKMLGITFDALEHELMSTTDLRLTQIDRYCAALGVGRDEVIVDTRTEEAGPKLSIKTVRNLYKIAGSLSGLASTPGAERMLTQLFEQFDELAREAKLPLDQVRQTGVNGIFPPFNERDDSFDDDD